MFKGWLEVLKERDMNDSIPASEDPYQEEMPKA